MTLRLGLIAIALCAAGCARPNGPSFVGLAELSPAERAQAVQPVATPSPAAQRVPSDKVLGAMAFQKVTGRSVNPERLSGRD